eukprot:228085_1
MIFLTCFLKLGTCMRQMKYIVSTNPTTRIYALKSLLKDLLLHQFPDGSISNFTTLANTPRIVAVSYPSQYSDMLPYLIESLKISLQQNHQESIIFILYCYYFSVFDKVLSSLLSMKDIQLIVKTSNQYIFNNSNMTAFDDIKSSHQAMAVHLLTTLLTIFQDPLNVRAVYFQSNLHLSIMRCNKSIRHHLFTNTKLDIQHTITYDVFSTSILFLTVLFDNNSIRHAKHFPFMCWKDILKDIMHLFVFVRKNYKNQNLNQKQYNTLSRYLLGFLACKIRDYKSKTDKKTIICNFKMHSNKYLIEWLVEKFVYKKDIRLREAFWSLMEDLCIGYWPDICYNLRLKHFCNPVDLYVPICMILNQKQHINSNIIKSLCFLLSTRRAHSNLCTQVLFHSGSILPLLQCYRNNFTKDINSIDFQLCASIYTVLTNPSPMSDQFGYSCFCIDFKQALNIGIVEISVEILRKCLQYYNENILNSKLNNEASSDLLCSTIWTIKNLMNYYLDGCVLEETKWLYDTNHLIHHNDVKYNNKRLQYIPHTYIEDKSASPDDSVLFPLQHYLIRYYPQHFIWRLKQCNAVEILKNVLPLKGADLTNWLQDTWNDSNTIDAVVDDAVEILKFIQKHDIDEKQLETDLDQLKQRIKMIEDEYYKQFSKECTLYTDEEKVANTIIYELQQISECLKVSNEKVLLEFDVSKLLLCELKNVCHETALYLVSSSVFCESFENILNNLACMDFLWNVSNNVNKQQMKIFGDLMVSCIHLFNHLTFHSRLTSKSLLYSAKKARYIIKGFVNCLCIYGIVEDIHHRNIWEHICIHLYMHLTKYALRLFSHAGIMEQLSHIFPPLFYCKGFESLIVDIYNKCLGMTEKEMMRKWKQNCSMQKRCCNLKCTRKASNLKKCSGCVLTYYCSDVCQKYHWKYGHSKQCKAFQNMINQKFD